MYEWPRATRRQVEARILILSTDEGLRIALLALGEAGRALVRNRSAPEHEFEPTAEAHLEALERFQQAAHVVVTA